MFEMENLDKRKFTIHFINRSVLQHKFSKAHRIQCLRNYSNAWMELDWSRKITFVAVETRWEVIGRQNRKQFMFLDCTGTFLLLPVSQEGWWIKGEEFMKKHLDSNSGETWFPPGVCEAAQLRAQHELPSLLYPSCTTEGDISFFSLEVCALHDLIWLFFFSPVNCFSRWEDQIHNDKLYRRNCVEMCELVDTTASKSCQPAIKTDMWYLVL